LVAWATSWALEVEQGVGKGFQLIDL